MKLTTATSPRRAARIWVPLLVLFVSLGLNYRAWERTRTAHEQEVRNYFAYRSRDALNRIDHRLKSYEQVLLAARSLFQASDSVTRAQFARFVAGQDVDEHYPGIQGVGYAVLVPAADREKHLALIRGQGFPNYQLRPEGNRDFFSPVIYLEPFKDRNLRAFGYDLLSEPVRREALQRAWDTGTTSMSGRVKLEQETEQDVQAGFLVYVPVYQNGKPIQTLADRRKHLVGWVNAPFRMNDLMQGVLGEGEADLDMEIFDGPEAKPEALMFDRDLGDAGNTPAAFSGRQALLFSGRSWTIVTRALPSLLARQGGEISKVGPLLGVLTSFLLAALAFYLVLDRDRTKARVAAGEDRYRRLMEQAQETILILDEGGRVQEVNQRALETFGYPENEIQALPFQALWEPDRAQDVPAWLERVRAEGSVQGEVLQVRRDGRRFPADLSATWVTFGSTGYLLVMIRDITARKREEEALRANEQRWMFALEGSGDGLWDWDVPTSRVLFSTRWKEMLGFAEDEIGDGLDEWELRVHPEDLPRTRADLKAHLDGTTPAYRGEHRVQCKDGTWKWILDRGLVVARDPEGRPLRVIGTHSDVTERRRMETALRESELRLRTILDSALDAVIGMDAEGRITHWNVRAEILFGWTKTEAVGLLLTETIIPPQHREAHDGGLARHLSTGVARMLNRRLELSALRRNGTEFPVELAVTELKTDGAREFTAFISDISQRKAGEEALRSLQAQLQQSQKMESLGILAGGVAHDMNNVLGAILGLATAHLEIQPAASPAYRAFDTITKAALRGASLVKSLLNFARQTPVENHQVDMNAILQEEVRLFERTTFSKIQLHLDLAPDLKPMQGDASALTHALMNLCVNAVDATPATGSLTLTTRNLDSAWIEIVVADTGSGMPKAVLDKALDPFFTTKAQGKGTGLGLSMVYSVVKAHQGRLELTSEVGRGTCVTLRFPACEPAPTAAEPPEEPAAAALQKRLLVLLVDDDELVQSSTQVLLDLLGHHTTAVTSGEAALAELEAGLQPDVVILDMNMPGLGGPATLPRLRALRPKLPVLLATGRVEQSALDLVEAHPGVTLMPKPYTLAELRKNLGAVTDPGAR